jgi:hypothetical protein
LVGSGLRIEESHVVRPCERDAGGVVAGTPGRVDVGVTQAQGYRGVGLPVEDELAQVERKKSAGGRLLVALWDGGRWSTEEGLDRVVAQPSPVNRDEIEEWGEPDHSGGVDGARSSGLGGCPEGQVSARRVPHEEEAAQVERRVSLVERGEVSQGRLDVAERGGPRMAFGPHPAVFEVPYGEPRPAQVLGDGRELLPTIRHPPETAVEETHQRSVLGAGQVQIPDLVRTWTIGEGVHDESWLGAIGNREVVG